MDDIAVKCLVVGMLREDASTPESVLAEATKVCGGDKERAERIVAETCHEVIDAQN